MSDNKEVFRPKRAVNLWEMSSWSLVPDYETGVKYPLKLGTHRVRVEYTFENQFHGWNLVAMRYYCERCGKEGYVEHSRLHEQSSKHIARARTWMLGRIISNDCV